MIFNQPRNHSFSLRSPRCLIRKQRANSDPTDLDFLKVVSKIPLQLFCSLLLKLYETLHTKSIMACLNSFLPTQLPWTALFEYPLKENFVKV